jgi:hypothetical protein
MTSAGVLELAAQLAIGDTGAAGFEEVGFMRT